MEEHRSLDAINADLRAARDEKYAAEQKRENLIANAKAQTADAISAATVRVNRLVWELQSAEEAAAHHPWVGQRVSMTDKKFRGRFSSQFDVVETLGVVEIVGPSNPWAGPSYRHPGNGQAVVRMLKKDGKPGARHERLSDQWKLVDPA